MIILLLASTFALSFVPLVQRNDEPTLEVTLSNPVFDPEEFTLALQLTSNIEDESGDTYEYHIYDPSDDEMEPITATVTADFPGPTPGDEPEDPEVPVLEDDSIDLSGKLADLVGLKEIAIDVWTTGDTPVKVTGDALIVTFGAKATAVTLEEEDEDNVKLTFTLDGNLGQTAGEETVKFMHKTTEIDVTLEDADDHIFSVVIAKTGFIGDAVNYGYFKGADHEDSTLPIWVPNEAAPVLVLTHLDHVNVKGTIEIPEDHTAWIKAEGEEEVEIEVDEDDEYATIPYATFVKATIVYLKDENGRISSLAQSIEAIPAVEPTPTWAIVESGNALSNDDPEPEAAAPVLKLTYAAAQNGNKVILYKKAVAEAPKTVAATFVTFTLEQIADESVIVCLTDGDDAVLSLPFAISAATFTEAVEEVEDDIVVTVTMAPGCLKAVPAELFVYPKAEEIDLESAQHYVIEWGTTAGEFKATIPAEDWEEETDVEGYVTVDLGEDEIEDAPAAISDPFQIKGEPTLLYTVKYVSPSEFLLTVTAPADHTAYIKTGDEAEEEIEEPVEISPADLVASKIYMKKDDEVVGDEITFEFPALPTPAWILVAEANDNTPWLEITFPNATFNGDIIKLVPIVEPEPEEPESNDVGDVTDYTVESMKVKIPLAKLVEKEVHLVHVDDNTKLTPKSLPLNLTNATFALTKGVATAEKQPVSFQMGVGIVAAKPENVVVITDGVTDWSKAEVYPLAFDGTTAGKLTGEVTLAKWKDIKDKDVLAYVTAEIEGELTEKPTILSEKFTLFEKEKPKEDDDDSAFSALVSVMALFFSVLVALF